MRHRFAFLPAALLILGTTGCGLTISGTFDGQLEDLGCSLRTPISLYSSNPSLSSLYGARWTNVELDSEIQTETVSVGQRYQPKTLSFFEMYYRNTATNEQRSMRRAGARLDVGTDSVGFANVYDGATALSFNDSTANTNKLFKTSFFGFEDATTKIKETWEIDILIKDERVTAVALTVPVMQRNPRTAFTSYTFTGRNQKLCVLDARGW